MLSLDVAVVSAAQSRLCALGGQDGTLRLTVTPTSVHGGNAVSWTRCLDGPLSKVLLLELESGEVALLVCVAVGYAVLYRYILIIGVLCDSPSSLLV